MSAAGPPQGANCAPLYADDSHLGCAMVGVGVGSRGPAQPVAPLSSKLVPEHVGVQVFAFVAKPEQLPERTSYVARMGYDKR